MKRSISLLSAALLASVFKTSAQAAIITYVFTGGGDDNSFYEHSLFSSNDSGASITTIESGTNVTGEMTFTIDTSNLFLSYDFGDVAFYVPITENGITSTFSLNEFAPPAPTLPDSAADSIFINRNTPVANFDTGYLIISRIPDTNLFQAESFYNFTEGLAPLTYITVDNFSMPTSFDMDFGTIESRANFTIYNTSTTDSDRKRAVLRVTEARMFVDGVEFTGVDDRASVPLPPSLAFLGAGIAGLVCMRKKMFR